MNFIPHLKATIILLCFLGYTSAAFADDTKIKVVVTIKPIEALVLAIAKDTLTIQRLLPDYASLHDYHFRPSDIRKLNNADLVFSIDEDMESFLAPLFKTLKTIPIISLADNHTIHLLSLDTDDEDEHHTPHNHTSSHQHDHNTDFHIWMSPHNGIAMAHKITHVLSQLNPQYADFYSKNLSALTNDINQFIHRFSRQSKAFNKKPYLVFHDSWLYFAKDFHLNKLATISLHADIQAGAKTIHNTRQLIEKSHAICLFSEPNFRPKTVNVLIEGFDIKTAEIDSLGSHLKVSPNLYLDLLKDTAQQVTQCLGVEAK